MDKQTPVSVIVGGMHGLGKSIARMFYQKGHHTLILDKTKENDAQEPFFHSLIRGDLNQTLFIAKALDRIFDTVPFVSNLVFSTKYRGPKNVEWEQEINLGITCVKTLIEGLHPLMSEQSGSIILLSSTASTRYTANCSPAYHCVKAATEQMIRYYAVRLGPLGIRVNGIAPGYLIKDESIAAFTAQEKLCEEVKRMHPLRRFGRAEDMTKVIDFLSSDASSFITGQTLVIDGGLSLYNPGFGEEKTKETVHDFRS